MRERSKRAARTRREKENHEFAELGKLLPLPVNVTSQLDKASVVKLTTAYLKLRELFPFGLGAPWGSAAPDVLLKDLASFLLQALEGFLIIVGPNSKIIYISEGVSFYLGLSQVEMMGNSINEYIHAYDQDIVKILLNHEEIIQIEDRIYEEVEIARSFSLRMKCVLTKRSAGLVNDNYKLIHCRGYLKLRPIRLAADETVNANDVRYNVAGLVAVGNAMHPTSILELKMFSHTFMYRAELDLKFQHLDPKAQDVIGYQPNHMLYKSLYKFVHVCDCFKIREDHLALIAKGQAVTGYYRFLTLSGGWVWMQSSFIVLLNSKSRETFILAINHVLSDCEYKQYVLGVEQASDEFNTHENVRSEMERQESIPESANNDKSKKRRKKSDTSAATSNASNSSFYQLSAPVYDSNATITVAYDSRLTNPFLNEITVAYDSRLTNSFLNEITVAYDSRLTNAHPLTEITIASSDLIPTNQSIYTTEMNSNRFQPIMRHQYGNSGEVSTTHFQSAANNQSVSTDEACTSQTQSFMNSQYFNAVDASAGHFEPNTHSHTLNTNASTSYLENITRIQPVNAAEISTAYFEPITHRDAVNTANESTSHFQSIYNRPVNTTEATSNERNTFETFADTEMTSLNIRQPVAQNTLMLRDLSWCINERNNNAYLYPNIHNESNVLEVPPVIRASNNDDLSDSFAKINAPSLSLVNASDCSSSVYSNFTNQLMQNELMSEQPGTSREMTVESSYLNINQENTFQNRIQHPYDFRLVCQNYFSDIQKYDETQSNIPPLPSDEDSMKNERSNVTKTEPQVIPSESHSAENCNSPEKYVSNTDSYEASERTYMNNISDDLRIKQSVLISMTSDTIKNEPSNKDQAMDACADNSFHKNIALNSSETEALLINPLNTPNVDLTHHWVFSNNFNPINISNERLDVRSERASSSFSMPPTPNSEQSSTNREFSFFQDVYSDNPNLNNSSDHSSEYSEQTYNEHSGTYFDVQSSLDTTNNRNDSFGVPFLQRSRTPLYTVL